jgi:leucyl-tRNA synthetase
MKYNPKEIEQKWQKYWAENQTLQLQTILKNKALYVRYVSLSIRGAFMWDIL